MENPAQLGCVLRLQEKSFLADRDGLRPYPTHLSPALGRLLDEVPNSSRAFAQLARQVPDELRRNARNKSRLRALDLPVRIVWGSLDPYCNLGVVKDFKTVFRRSTSTFTTAGHWPQLEAPTEVAEALLGPI